MCIYIYVTHILYYNIYIYIGRNRSFFCFSKNLCSLYKVRSYPNDQSFSPYKNHSILALESRNPGLAWNLCKKIGPLLGRFNAIGYIHIYVYICVYIYIHTQTHTHIHRNFRMITVARVKPSFWMVKPLNRPHKYCQREAMTDVVNHQQTCTNFPHFSRHGMV